jgi:hypothetical protein
MVTAPARTLGQARLACLMAAAAVLAACGLCAAAILVPAPAAAVPLIVVVCVGLPMLAVWDLSGAVQTLRAGRDLRRTLEALPETRHPLGL